MNKIPVLIASNSASDAHQAMFLRILQDCLLILMLCFTRILNICLHPNNILTSSKAPLFQTLSSEVKSLPRTTPQEDKGPLSGHVLNFEVHDVLPVPGGPCERDPAGPTLVLLEGWGNVDDIELCTHGGEVKRINIKFYC